MDYPFSEIEEKWKNYWEKEKTFAASDDHALPKYYVLDMFPYPSGAGLHVGHPLGYIASDIVARYKRLNGYNVLHPMGFDAFGLPAEQYAIQTGQHPETTTKVNSERYISQLKNIGFAYDWDRMVNTSDPEYYRWTQWIFLKLFNSWYDPATAKARPLEALVAIFETQGNKGYDEQTISGNIEQHLQSFDAEQWKKFDEKCRGEILMCYRLAYQSYAYVNWCEALGTVLANDEVKDGVSERGGHPVERRQMRQWFLRITAYAERLLNELDTLDWSDSMKEMQRNWIGKSVGALMTFKTENGPDIEIFTTRPDTIFGVTFMVVAPESELVPELTTAAEKAAVEAYVNEAKNRSERERMADVKKVSGAFSGTYAIHPFTGKKIPVWIGDYVLAGYGTGAVMAVPGHDGRDFNFAKHFGLEIPRVIAGADGDASPLADAAYEAKDGTVINSDFITGMPVKKAMQAVIEKSEAAGIGKRQVNYRLRDANFSRQRYWGEPFPIYYKNEVATAMPESALPLELPKMDDFKPTGRPESPLAKLTDWTYEGHPLETDTMPGFAGSSWYFLRYMDAKNTSEFASQKALEYWQDVDLYIGGTEHAVGHLLYSRFWHKLLFDYGLVPTNEPFRKLVNQGMIQGRSNFVYRVKGKNQYVSSGLKDQHDTIPIHVDVNIVSNDELNIETFRSSAADAGTAEFILENGKYICGWEVEKMSKSKYNVVSPDDIVKDYGADTLRMYEMFLGPVEQSKPWNTNGIEGVHKFLRKLWRTCVDANGNLALTEETPTKAELKILHKTIKKIGEDIDNFSLNTCISAFMICLNELNDADCRKKAIFSDLFIILSPFAPHIAEELWQRSGHTESISKAAFPTFNPENLVESSFEYPVSFNGKARFKLELELSLTPAEVEKAVRENEQTTKWLEGKAPKKIIVVPGRIVNVVM